MRLALVQKVFPRREGNSEFGGEMGWKLCFGPGYFRLPMASVPWLEVLWKSSRWSEFRWVWGSKY